MCIEVRAGFRSKKPERLLGPAASTSCSLESEQLHAELRWEPRAFPQLLLPVTVLFWYKDPVSPADPGRFRLVLWRGWLAIWGGDSGSMGCSSEAGLVEGSPCSSHKGCQCSSTESSCTRGRWEDWGVKDSELLLLHRWEKSEHHTGLPLKCSLQHLCMTGFVLGVLTPFWLVPSLQPQRNGTYGYCSTLDWCLQVIGHQFAMLLQSDLCWIFCSKHLASALCMSAAHKKRLAAVLSAAMVWCAQLVLLKSERNENGSLVRKSN